MTNLFDILQNVLGEGTDRIDWGKNSLLVGQHDKLLIDKVLGTRAPGHPDSLSTPDFCEG